MIRLLVGLLIIRGRRLRHLAYVQDDPLFRPFAGLRRIPTARTMTTVDRCRCSTPASARGSCRAWLAHVDDRCRRRRGLDGWTRTNAVGQRAGSGFSKSSAGVRRPEPGQCVVGSYSSHRPPGLEAGPVVAISMITAASPRNWGDSLMRCCN
jgi:hypothetical protein